MKKFIQKLMQIKTLPESSLYKMAKKCHDNPNHGIEIKIKAAYHVIKDCAKYTYEYLPLVVLRKNLDKIRSGSMSSQWTDEEILSIQDTVYEWEIINYLKSNDISNKNITSDPVPESVDIYGDYAVDEPLTITNKDMLLNFFKGKFK